MAMRGPLRGRPFPLADLHLTSGEPFQNSRVWMIPTVPSATERSAQIWPAFSLLAAQDESDVQQAISESLVCVFRTTVVSSATAGRLALDVAFEGHVPGCGTLYLVCQT